MWYTKLQQYIGRQMGRLRQSPPHLAALAIAQHYAEPPAQFSYALVYQQSPAVYLAVNRIAEAGALVPLNVYAIHGEQRQAVVNHPLEALLNNPNPYLSRFELFEQTLGMLELTGNAYWFIAGDAQGQPAEIWTLRPDRVTIVPHPQRYIAGYLYEVDGQRIPLETVEVVHFKRWNPANAYYGLSTLEAARMAVQSDRAMAQWNYQTFGKDNGVPAGIVSIKDYVSDSDFERIKQEWRTSYGGGKRRTAFLRGGTIEWQNIGLSHTEVDFLHGRKAHRDEILNLFGIPIGLISENATEANAKVAERLFIERTLYPKLVRLAQKITQELLPFYAGQWVAEFADIRPTDVQARLNEIRTAQNVLSINEIRAQYYALPAVTWGELPVGMQPSPTIETTEQDTEKIAVMDDPSETLPQTEPESAAKAILEELAQWERFALKRLEKPHSRPFTVNAIPSALAFEISANLLLAEDKTAIKAVFAAVREQRTATAM